MQRLCIWLLDKSGRSRSNLSTTLDFRHTGCARMIYIEIGIHDWNVRNREIMCVFVKTDIISKKG